MGKISRKILDDFLDYNDGAHVTSFQPSNWSLDISFLDLFRTNEYIMVDRNYIPNENSNCIKGYCLYFKHPKSDKYSIKIGIDNLGFVYIGDQIPDKNYPLESVHGIYQEIMAYRDWVLHMDSNKEKLLRKGIDYDNLFNK
jgi:hypothetical protein